MRAGAGRGCDIARARLALPSFRRHRKVKETGWRGRQDTPATVGTGTGVRMGRIGAVLALLGAAAAVFYAYGRPPVVALAKAQRGSAAEVVYATGVVEPRVWAKVAPQARTRIAWHCRCEGERVQAGHVLARLDDSAPRAELAQAEARAEFLSAELTRQTDLIARGTGTRAGLERAQSEAAQAVSQVAALKARLTDYILTAPLAGTVLRADGYVGEIASGEPLFWVGQERPLRVVSEVNEEDVPRIVSGMATLLRNDGFPDTGLRAVVGDITPKGDPVSKTFRVYLDLPADTPLRIGMSVEANIIVREKPDALLVPAEAVAEGRVQVLREGRAVRQPVRTGIRGTRFIEIVEGIAVGESVLSPARPDIPDGAAVRPGAGG